MFQEIGVQSEHILKYIIKNKTVTSEQLQQQFPKLQHGYLDAHIIYLQEQCLIAFDDTFAPTASGMLYFEIRNKARLYAVAQSVIAPIIVALITTLITLSLNGVTIKLLAQ